MISFAIDNSFLHFIVIKNPDTHTPTSTQITCTRDHLTKKHRIPIVHNIHTYKLFPLRMENAIIKKKTFDGNHDKKIVDRMS